MPHKKVFLKPFIRVMCDQFERLSDDMDKAFVQHSGKQMMKIQEDPWDNYLYYDSKYVLPMICHSADMPIERQALLAMFMKRSIEDETISQYKV